MFDKKIRRKIMEIVAFCTFCNYCHINEHSIDEYSFNKALEQCEIGRKVAYINLDFLTDTCHSIAFCSSTLSLNQYILESDTPPIADFLSQEIGYHKNLYSIRPDFKSIKNINMILSLVSMEIRTGIIVDKLENILKQLGELSFDIVILSLPVGYSPILVSMASIRKSTDYIFLSQVDFKFIDNGYCYKSLLNEFKDEYHLK